MNRSIVLDSQTTLDVSNVGPGLVGAAELIWNYPGWTATDRTRFVEWTKNVLKPAADFKKMRSLTKNAAGAYVLLSWVCATCTTKPYYGNHNNWGVLLSLSIDHLTGNVDWMKEDTKLLKTLIDMEIASDGTLPQEMTRGQLSILYTAFALEPFTAAIEVVRNSGGENLYNWTAPGGGSTRKALDFLFNRGVEDPSLWPISGATADTSHVPELFAAMGRVYGIAKWTSFGNPPVPDLDTGVGWPLPTLFQPLPLDSR